MPPVQHTIGVPTLGPALTADIDLWSNNNPSGVLVVAPHGMQDPPRGHGGLDLAGPLLKRNYAFTTAFNTALDNAGLPLNPAKWVPFATAFRIHGERFASTQPPSLRIYPYLNAIGGLAPSLETLAQAGSCDVLYLTDLNPYPARGYIFLDDLLRSQHPLGGGRFYDIYASFLVLACRSSTAPYQVGMGGAPGAPPDGLYRLEDRPALMRQPFPGAEAPL